MELSNEWNVLAAEYVLAGRGKAEINECLSQRIRILLCQ